MNALFICCQKAELDQRNSLNSPTLAWFSLATFRVGCKAKDCLGTN